MKKRKDEDKKIKMPKTEEDLSKLIEDLSKNKKVSPFKRAIRGGIGRTFLFGICVYKLINGLFFSLRRR